MTKLELIRLRDGDYVAELPRTADSAVQDRRDLLKRLDIALYNLKEFASETSNPEHIDRVVAECES